MLEQQNLQEQGKEQGPEVIDGQKPSEASEAEKLKEEGEDKPLTPEETKLLRAEVKAAKETAERLKKEQLDTKTSPQFFDNMRKQQDIQRRQRILDPNLPQGKALSDEDYDGMTGSQIMKEVRKDNQSLYANITRNKIVPMDDQREASRVDSQIKDVADKVPWFWEYKTKMVNIATVNSGLDAKSVLFQAVQESGDWDRLDELTKIYGRKPKETKAGKEKIKEAKAGIAEKPAAGVTGVTKQTKKMTPREAAEAAYDEHMEGKGG